MNRWLPRTSRGEPELQMIARYTKTAMVFHWLVAALIVANVALAWLWPVVADERVRPLIDTHKSIGITVLGLAIMRVLWRLTHRPPAYPAHYRGWERSAASLVHAALYLIMFGMPLTGWIMDSAYKDAATHPMFLFGLFEWPRIAWFQHLDPAKMDRAHDFFGAAHGLGAYALYALVLLHVGGALKHQWLDRAPELQRMWPGRR
jgi:cytochrome b561